MSDQANIIPLNDVDDTIKNYIIVTVNGRDLQYKQEDIDVSFEMSELEIMDKVVPLVEESEGVNIRDSFKVRKTTNNENIYIYPNSTAGVYYRCPACGYYAFNGIECFDCGYRI